MSVYIYCLKSDYKYQSAITDQRFENKWMRLTPDGIITIKGSHGQGYAWDGCSPKLKFKDIYFGTPEGVLCEFTGNSKTYYASLIHDAFYQFSFYFKYIIPRKAVDLEFYKILKRNNFQLSRLYYFMVRVFGWMPWYSRKRR